SNIDAVRSAGRGSFGGGTSGSPGRFDPADRQYNAHGTRDGLNPAHADGAGLTDLAGRVANRMRQGLFTLPSFGGLKVFGYGAMLVLAFISSTWLACWRARRERLEPEVIMDMAFWVFLLGMVGARLFYCIEYWGTEIKNLWEVVEYWKGGIV